MVRINWDYGVAGLVVLTSILTGCGSSDNSQAGRAIVQAVVTGPKTLTPVPGVSAPAAAGPEATPTLPLKPANAPQYEPPAAPQTLASAQVQATREAFEKSIADADDRLRHTIPYATPTPTMVFQRRFG